MRLTFVVSILFALGLSACNTVQGVGQDVQKVGEAIERTGSK